MINMVVPTQEATARKRLLPPHVLLRIALLGVLVYTLLGVWTELRFFGQWPPRILLMVDFNIYARAYTSAWHGHDPYSIRTIGDAFLYPPTALLIIGPFAAIPTGLARFVIYGLVNLGLLLLILRGIARRYGYTLNQTWWWYVLASAFGPTIELITIGQINMFAAWGICCAFLYADTLPALAGAGLALAISTKVTPAALLLYLLVTRRWTAIAWSFIAIAILSVASVALFGLQPFLTYVDVFRNLVQTYLPGNPNVQALVSLLNYHGWLTLAAMAAAQHWLTIYLIAVCMASSLLALWRRHYEPLFIVVSLSSMVAPTVMWYHHYVLALAPLLVWMAWSRLNPTTVLWCCTVMTVLQLDRWMLTDGLFAQAAIHLSILGLLLAQAGLLPRGWLLPPRMSTTDSQLVQQQVEQCSLPSRI